MFGSLCYDFDMSYTIIDHTADLGIKVQSMDIPSLFTEAAYALVEIMGAKANRPEREIALDVEGYDREDLLVRWLEEIRYRIESQALSIAGMTIETLTAQRLEASIAVAPRTSPLKTGIKAVTYHALEIHEVDNLLQTDIIFDT
ncbi:MAG: archease [Syntrophaceae bacterium]